MPEGGRRRRLDGKRNFRFIYLRDCATRDFCWRKLQLGRFANQNLALRLGRTTLLASPAYSFPQLRSLEYHCTPNAGDSPRLDDDSLLFLLRSSSVSFCHFVSVLFHFLTFFLRRAFRLQKGSGFSLKFLFWFFFSFFFCCCFSLSGARGILPGPSGPGGAHESLQKTKENGTPSAAHVLITKSRDLSGKPRCSCFKK